MKQTGILYIVATPIGNLKDFTFRAQEVLKSVHLIAAEDTRHSSVLLKHYGIATPVVALHEHNELQISKKIMDHLAQGQSIALISDAGTPLISDPGFPLVKQARQKNIQIVPIPGACAAIAAISAAGLSAEGFVYEGFLSAKSAKRQSQLKQYVNSLKTLVFYESPHRIVATVADMRDCFGGSRTAVIARELTKQYETIHQASLDEMYDWLVTDPQQQKGEFVVLVEGIKKINKQKVTAEAEQILTVLLEDLSLKQAAQLAAKITGIKKQALYQLGLTLKTTC